MITMFNNHREVAALALANPATPFSIQCQLQARLRQTAARIIGLASAQYGSHRGELATHEGESCEAHPVGNTGYTSKQLALGQAVDKSVLSGVSHG